MSFQSSTSSTYMDGVPVKISEKYKPPPKVTIPQSIINRLNSDGYPNGIFDYDFILERKVIKKIDEWKKVRELECQQRQERLRKLEIERAREYEEKEKLLLTSVSYPNADDLSSGDEDSPEDSSSAATASGGGGSGNNTIIQSNQPKQQFSPLQQPRFDTILMPTVVPDNYTYINNISPIYQQQNGRKATTTTNNYNKSNGNNDITSGIDKINYSDFENDTSSPFDNIELKTINDLDVLAQVLNVTQIHSIQQNPVLEESNNIDKSQQQQQLQECKVNNKNITNFNNDYYRNSTNNTPTGELTQQQSTTANQWTIDNSNPMNHIIHHTLVNNQTNLYYPSNNIFYPSNNYDNTTTQLQNYVNMNDVSGSGGGTTQITGITGNSIGGQQINTNIQGNRTDFYYSNYNNMPSNQNYLYNSYPINLQRNNIDISVPPPNYNQKHNFINQQQQQQQQQQHFNQQQHILLTHNNLENKNSNQNLNAYGINDIKTTTNGIQCSTKSKSKSVPDILQELNDEIRDSELRRARNHSQTLADHINKKTDNLDKNDYDSIETPQTFIKLSSSLQSLVQNISSMGFPLERVARIAEKLGNDDKKIFEHLIPLTELLDLGFDESKISDALLKFDNNKEQALDFLIS